MKWWKPPAYLILVTIAATAVMNGFEFFFGEVDVPLSAGEGVLVFVSFASGAALVHWALIR